MAKLRHSNIIRVYDVDINANEPYIVMDYIEGYSLKEYLQKTPLNIRMLSQLMIKIGKAIQYAHKQGVIHRDLKPANIMLDKKLEPQVMDFGLAKLTMVDQSLSKKGAILGSPMYMSPEQAKGEKVNHLADVYALGAIFYEMLCGKTLIQGEIAANIIFNVIHKDPILLRNHNHKLSLDLQTICHKAVAKSAEKRYQTTQQFIDDIKRFLDGELISARPTSLHEHIWAKLRKNKLIILIVALSVFMAIFVPFLVFSYQKKQQSRQLNYYREKAQKALKQSKEIENYIQAASYLEKALELAPKNKDVHKFFLHYQKEIGQRAIKQENYLLGRIAFKKCKKINKDIGNKLLFSLKEKQNANKKKNINAIHKMMAKISTNTSQEMFEWYVFKIVKMAKPYVVKTLVAYLKQEKEQKKLAIKALGRLKNNYTKVEGKDSVELLLQLLQQTKNEKEIIEIIWALGWLKDSRADIPVHKARYLHKENSIIWEKTKTPYRWIPTSKKRFIETPNNLLEQGNIRTNKGNYFKAIMYFSRVIKLSPKNSEGYNNRGLVYRKLKKYRQAIADFTKAIRFNPDNANLYNNRGNVYQGIKRYTKAISDYSLAIKLRPKFSKAYNNRGNAYQDIKKYAKAISNYTKAIHLKPTFLKAYGARANAYCEMGLYKKALADCDKALRLNKLYAPAYGTKGLIYYNQKAFKKALVCYTKAMDIRPKFANSYSNRGLAYEKLKIYTRALADYTSAIKLNRNYHKAYKNRGLLYYKLRLYKKAIIDQTIAIKLNPEYYLSYNYRGLVYLQLKEYAKAIADFTTIIKKEPKNALAYNNRGLSYLRWKKYSKGLIDCTMAIKLNPKNPHTYNNRGFIYQQLRQYKKAINDYTKAIKLDVKYYKAYDNRGFTYQKLRQYKKAIADHSKAIKIKPKYTTAYYHRGVVYSRTKQHKKAIVDYTVMIKRNPKHYKAYNNRAITYLELKEYAKALSDSAKTIKINPRHYVAYSNKGLAYSRLKQYKKAIKSWQIFLKLAPNHRTAPRVRAWIKHFANK